MRKVSFQFILRAVLIVFSVYVIYNFFSMQSMQGKREAELAALQQEVSAQMLYNQQMEDSINDELSDEEIAAIAREKLGFALPGERIFIDITGK